MSFTLCTLEEAHDAAGAGASTVVEADTTYLNSVSDSVEALIAVIARYDVVTNYASLSTQTKNFIKNIARSLIAIEIAKYDVAGYAGQREQELIMDALDSAAKRDIALLEDDSYKTYLGLT